MTSLRQVFVIISATLTVLSMFLLVDILFVGVISLVAKAFDGDVAQNIFKYGVAVLFGIELLLTIPAVIKSIKEGDKK